jgi:alcohol dehydrogenase
MTLWMLFQKKGTFSMNLLNPFSFELPTRIEYGRGVAQRLLDELKNMHAKKVLVVTDKGIEAAGLLAGIDDQLSRGDFVWEVFSDVEANPKDYNIREGVKAADRLKPDCLVAVGGGSPIDSAKAVAVVSSCGGKVRDYAGKNKITGEITPLIAIPTTAGTGSEVTFSSVITDSKEKIKFSIRHSKIAPRVALLDPQMTLTMPPDLTAATGMDALTHAIEAFTAKVAQPLADAAALYAVELIFKYLKTAVFDGSNLEARAGMLLGSVLAGISFSHSDCAAVHCIAETLGGKYDVAHGVCNAVVLSAVMDYNLEYCGPEYARIAAAMGIEFEDPQEGARRAVDAVQKLASDVNLPDFRSFGVKESDLEALAGGSVRNVSNEDNPRPMAKEDYLYLLKKLVASH